MIFVILAEIIGSVLERVDYLIVLMMRSYKRICLSGYVRGIFLISNNGIISTSREYVKIDYEYNMVKN